MNMYAYHLHALPPIGQAFEALAVFGLRYVLPSALIVLALVAVLLLDLWLIKLETRRSTDRDEAAPSPQGRTRLASSRLAAHRVSSRDGSRVDRPTNPGLA